MSTTISSNPFALLSGGDSDDEGGAIKPILKVTKAPVSVAPQPKKTIPGQQPKRDRGDYPSRGAPRKVYGGQSGGGAEAEVIGAKPAGFTDHGRDDRAERRGGHRGGRGTRARGSGRGRGGGRFDERPDRHSATGTHDTDRKVASGWGAEEGKEELQAETDGYGDAKAAMTPADADDGWGAKAGEDAPAAPNGHGETDHPREEEEEDKTKTFEEYLAEKANSANALLSLKKDVRKPNEGADDSQWKNAIKLVKGEEEEEVFFQANKEKKTGQANKKVKEKTFIEVEPLGYRPPRFSGERGGRGRGRGRGDRDGPDRRDFNENRGRGGGRGRGGHAGGRDFNTEDANAFPSLS